MKTYKSGDLVRVQGNSFNKGPGDSARHHIKPGAVCVVLAVSPRSVSISGPTRKDCRPGHESLNNHVGEPITQSVYPGQIKLAKQAMKKRAAYAARRGSPFEIPSALVSADLAAAEQRWAHP